FVAVRAGDSMVVPKVGAYTTCPVSTVKIPRDATVLCLGGERRKLPGRAQDRQEAFDSKQNLARRDPFSVPAFRAEEQLDLALLARGKQVALRWTAKIN